MAAPSVIVREQDLSTRVPSFPGVYEGIVIRATKGELDQPRLVTSENDLLKYFTPNERIEVGMDLGYFSALAALEKTNKLWVMRASNNPKTGGFYYHIDGTITQMGQTTEFRPKVEFKVSGIKENNNKVTISDLSKGKLEWLKGREIIIKNVGKYTITELEGNLATLDKGVTPSVALPTSVELTIPENKVNIEATFQVTDVNTSEKKLTINTYDGGQHGLITDLINGKQFYLGDTVGVKYTVTLVEAGSDANEKIVTVSEDCATLTTTPYTGHFNYEKVLREELQFSLSEFVDGESKLKATMTKGTIDKLNTLELDLTSNDLETYTVTNVDNSDMTLTLDKPINNQSLVDESTAIADEVKLEAKQMDDPTAEPMDNTVLFAIYGANPGEWNNDIRVKVQTNYSSKRIVQKTDRYGSPLYLDDHDLETTTQTLKPVMVEEETFFNPVKEPDAFLIQVFKSSNLNIPVEQFEVSRDINAKNGYGDNMYIEDQVNRSNYIRVINNNSVDASTPIPTMNKTQFEYEDNKLHDTIYDHGLGFGYYGLMIGGDDGLPVTDSNMILAAQKFRSKISYLMTVLLDGGWATPAYQKELIKIAEERKDCIAVLSTPYSAEASFNYTNALTDYVKFTLNANTSYAAMYTPHVKIVDKYNNRELWIAPDGYAGAQISYTASNYELWYPVGGMKRGVINAFDTRRRFETGELDALYDAGINPIRFYPGKGIVIWGQKTLTSRPSALDRLNVRLMLITIEPAIGEALEDFLFELNDSSTRSNAKYIVESYMRGIQARKGVSDFMVVCDDSNNTAEDIDNYRMNVDLYVKPMRGIDWIVFTTVITRTGMSFGQAQQSLRS